MSRGSAGAKAARVVSVNISESTGERKHNVERCAVLAGHGLEDDAHAGEWHRQVSLLAVESIDKMRLAGLDVWPGDFGENITTQGVELVSLPVGTRIMLGPDVVLEVTQIGKECQKPCAIYYQAGDCVMPREGIFARVLEGGEVRVGDQVEVGDVAGPGCGAAVLTLSDKGAAGEREDRSGAVVREALEAAGITVERAEILPDDRALLEERLRQLVADGFSLVVTTGGTGLSPRDVTPEATLAVIEKEIPGMAEAMRAESLKVTPHAMLSRAVCGLAGRTLIVNLPGSPKGARECLSVVMGALPHAIEVSSGAAYECAEPEQAD